MKTTIHKIIVFALLLCFFLSGFNPVLAEGETETENEEEETIYIDDTFYCITAGTNRTFQVPFNPNWFRDPATEYDHDLAKLSLGLATAAFRPHASTAGSEAADKNLRSFLEKTGFSDLRSDDYDKDPGRYTVSTVMGHRQVGEGDDAFQLIAVGICGQGYVDEWESNFSIGSGVIPDGFDRSARIVFDRIFGYMSTHHIEGPVKIWLSGFSRAAAISNITAARLSETDTFSQETVYAYTFGTPYTTREENIPEYKNIFNICGKMDPVTSIPFRDWGYQRYGVTLQTPAQETDSDFAAKRLKANAVYRQVTGLEYWANSEMNLQIRVVMDYLLRICPDVETYVNSLQDNLISLWERHDPVSVMTRLLDMANDPILINEENRKDANMFLNTLSYLVLDYASSDNAFRRWNSNASAGSNLLQSHTPELYISWVYSADRASELYTRSRSYTQAFIEGDVTVTLIRGDHELEKLSTGEDDTTSVHQYLSFRNGKISVMIPRDRDYYLLVTSNIDQTVGEMEGVFRVGRQTPQEMTTNYFEMKAGEEYHTKYEGGTTASASSIEESYSTTDTFDSAAYFYSDSLNRFSNRNFETLTWREVVLGIFILVFLTALFLLFLVTLIISWLRFRHRRKRGFVPAGAKFRPLPILATFLIQQAFFIGEFRSILYPDQQTIDVDSKIFIGAMTLIIAFYGYRRKKDRFHLLLMGVILLLAAADTAMLYSVRLGGTLHVLAYTFLTYIFIREDRPSKLQILLWLLIAATGIVYVLRIPGTYGYLRAVAILYVLSSSAMVVSSFHLASRTFRGTLLLFISGLLLIYNQANSTNALFHLISLGTYYTAVITLASSGSGFIRGRTVPVTMLEEKETEGQESAAS